MRPAYAASTLPAFRSELPSLYRCDACGGLVIATSRRGRGCSGVDPPTCCRLPMRNLVPREAGDAPADVAAMHRPVLTITGGFDHNTVTVRVGIGGRPHAMASDHHVEWIWLRSFEGGHLKYLEPGQPPEATFALSGEDAFGYCGRPICKMGREHCLFQCKRGYVAYAHCAQHGLWAGGF